MSLLHLDTDSDAYLPGSEMRVTFDWNLPEPPDAIEVRLVWNTSGKGDRDLKVAQTLRWDQPDRQGREETVITLPWGPYSFSGKLISLIWAVELVALPKNESARREIVIGPGNAEVLIGTARPGS